jgi:hypothetical protein
MLNMKRTESRCVVRDRKVERGFSSIYTKVFDGTSVNSSICSHFVIEIPKMTRPYQRIHRAQAAPGVSFAALSFVNGSYDIVLHQSSGFARLTFSLTNAPASIFSAFRRGSGNCTLPRESTSAMAVSSLSIVATLGGMI